MQQIFTNEIYTPAHRIKSINAVAVDSLAHSIAEIGLQNPIQVVQTTDGYIVVAGMHRFKACIKLGWKQIPAVILAEDTPAEQLLAIEIDENICQGTLNACELIESLYIRKQGYEKLHPETMNGGNNENRHTGDEIPDCKNDNLANPTENNDCEPIKRFTLHIAELTGVSESKIKAGIRAYPILTNIWHLVKMSAIKDQFTQITSLASATDLQQKHTDEDFRLTIIELINSPDFPLIKKVADAQKQIWGQGFETPEVKNILAFETRWGNAGADYKNAVYTEYHAEIIGDLTKLGYLK